jgi:hypothetical protein
MIAFEETVDGVVVPVKAQAGARRNGITGIHAGCLKVAVTQAPEKGKANEAIIVVLAELMHLRRHQVELISGATSSQKRFLVTGIARAELEQRITDALTPRP